MSGSRERLFLAITIVGFVVPNTMLAVFIARHGVDPQLYFSPWFGTLPSAQLGADLAICCLAFLGWTAWDGPRSGVRRW